MSYVSLATTTLSSTTQSVTFSSIPATYKDLVIVVSGSATAGRAFDVFLNGNTTRSNYSRVWMLGTGSSPSSGAESNPLLLEMGSGQTAARVQFFDYAATDKHKTILTRSDSATGITIAFAGRFANTGAVTSIRLDGASEGASFNSGTTLSLYGIA